MSLKLYLVGRERRRRRAASFAPELERRAPEAEAAHFIGLRDQRVSRRHAEIYVVESRIFLRDLGSKNGTYVVDRKGSHRLVEGYIQPEQVVSFGGCRRRVGELLAAEPEPIPQRERSGGAGSG